MDGPAPTSDVMEVLKRQPPPVQRALARMRQIIFEAAADLPEIGGVSESLKWGQPSYAPRRPRTGTPVRIDADATHGGDVALYVNCQTNLVEGWRERYPELTYGTTRSVHFRASAPLPEAELRHMIAEALTYHRRKR